LRKSASSVTGVYAERILEDFSCSKFFLGVDGIDLEFGLSTTNVAEAQLNRCMIQTAQKPLFWQIAASLAKEVMGRSVNWKMLTKLSLTRVFQNIP